MPWCLPRGARAVRRSHAEVRSSAFVAWAQDRPCHHATMGTRSLGRLDAIVQRHDPSRALRQPRRSRRAVRGRPGGHRAAVELVGRRDRPRDPRRDVLRDRDGGHRRLPPAADAPLLPRRSVAGAQLRGAGPAERAGLGPGLGRRPPQAPRAHRRRGRPAQPARRPRQRPARPLARAHRLADGDPGPGRLEEVRQGPLRGSQDEGHRPALPALRAGVAADPDRRWASSCTASPGRARCAATSGAAWSGSSSCTTSRGRSTRSATTSARAASTSRTSPPTWRGWRSRRSASPGITITMPSRGRRATGSSRGRSTSRRW